ncbi:hypothetical protein BaRGS_00014637 [Batillaria attramentaria]|uniref:PH domain-containing protein n=1 Tax=Batillaria attramentaria TaxID=370345 RepID=A0ABD0L409_9CAEN
MHGYLHRKTFNDQWPSPACADGGQPDGCLYCYLTPDDRVTVDVTDLDGYSVTSLEDKFPGQRFVIHLDHEDYISVYLSASSREELEEWHQALTSAIQVTPRTNGHDHQEEDPGAAGARGGRVTEERVLSVKQKLLAEVLRQKQELEKKQATRLANKKQLSLDDSEVGSPPATPPTPTGEQICTLTRLRQRRMSTQIKMDTLQRQIQTNGHKKSRFHFGKKKGDETPPKHNPDIVEQLKTLSDHLSEIDRDLVQNGAVTLDRAHAHRKLQMPGLRHSYDLESSTLHEGGKTLPRANGVDGILSEESGITRSNSLKSSMQKLAHRTFARAGWRAKKSSQGESVDKDDADDRTHGSTSHDNGNSDAPDVVDLSHRLMRTWPARDSSNDSAGDEQNGGGGSEALTFLPPPSSFNGDEYSPVSSPRSARSTGSASGASSDQGHHRSNASHLHRHHVDLNNMFPLKSPRRQVDPGAMANIEAFEELSRQILGEEAS